jgi:hypothetical protein
MSAFSMRLAQHADLLVTTTTLLQRLQVDLYGRLFVQASSCIKKHFMANVQFCPTSAIQCTTVFDPDVCLDVRFVRIDSSFLQTLL